MQRYLTSPNERTKQGGYTVTLTLLINTGDNIESIICTTAATRMRQAGAPGLGRAGSVCDPDCCAPVRESNVGMTGMATFNVIAIHQRWLMVVNDVVDGSGGGRVARRLSERHITIAKTSRDKSTRQPQDIIRQDDIQIVIHLYSFNYYYHPRTRTCKT